MIPQPSHNYLILDLTSESESPDPDNPTAPFLLPDTPDLPVDSGHKNKI